MSNEDDTTELEKLYDQAVARNQAAKVRLKSSALASWKGRPARINTNHELSQQQLLNLHLDDLRLQRQYDKLRTLSRYVVQAGQIVGNQESHYEFGSGGQALHKSKIVPDDDFTRTQDEVVLLKETAKGLVSNVELAVVKARQQLKREQSLLLQIQQETLLQNVDGTTDLQALEATRDELQSWIGGSLASCEQDRPSVVSDINIRSASKQSLMYSSNFSIEEEYEKYLEVRTRLLRAVKELKSSITLQVMDTSTVLEPNETIVSQEQKSRLQKKGHIHGNSRLRANETEGPHTPSLVEIWADHLPEYHHEKLMSTHLAHLTEQTRVQDSRLAQGLGLLNHESHLLPSHPIPVAERSMHRSIASSSSQAETYQLLRAWAFASEIANDKLEEAIEAHVDRTKTALERADDNIEGMIVMHNMKKDLTS